MAERFFATQAWLDGGWARDVLLTVGPDGCWAGVQPGPSADQAQGAQRLAGPVLPGLVNAHSHAFQRAIAGLTERAGPAGSSDDFWSWRDRMYSVARRITPEQLEHIAAWLYAERWPAATPRSVNSITCTSPRMPPGAIRWRCHWRWCARPSGSAWA